MTRLKFLFLCGSLLSCLAPARVAAQDTAPDPTQAPKIQLGALGLSPRIVVTNLGVDTNVLNQSTGPQGDFTTNLAPGVDSSLRIGRGLLRGKTTVELDYFKKIATQRSIGFGQEGRFDLFLNAFMPYLEAAHVKTYRRPNAEIDTRVGQTTNSLGLGANLRLSWRTTAQVEVDESRLQLDDDQFLGVNLSLALDRRVQAANLNFRIALTPLTTFVVKNRLQHDRFTFSPERDTDSVSVAPGFEFKPTALIAGSAFVGYRRFQPRRPDQARFAGVVAAVKLGYLIRDTMRIRGTLDRDVDYSAEATQAFLLVTGGGVDLTQSLGGRWDAVLRVGRQYLDYRNLSLLDPTENRRDRTTAYGTGLGYRLRPDMRVGFDVNYLKRLSPIPTRRYSGFQFGGSFTYGS